MFNFAGQGQNIYKLSLIHICSVNVNAIEEYKEISERHAFLDAQHTDLVKAAETLQGIIDELDAGMRKQFTEKFEEIRKEFDRVFRQLFGGGKGTLELEEDTDVLLSLIHISERQTRLSHPEAPEQSWSADRRS